MAYLAAQNTWFGPSSNLEPTSGSFAATHATFAMSCPSVSIASMRLKSAILKLRWIGQDDEADRLLAECGPSEIFPMEPMETD